MRLNLERKKGEPSKAQQEFSWPILIERGKASSPLDKERE